MTLADTENRQQPRANDRRGQSHHAGLLLQRFFADPMRDPSTGAKRDKRDPEGLKALMRAAIAACESEPVRALYEAAHTRWIDSLSGNRAYASQQLETSSRLIVGLGSESVLETGLRLHHTYGVPIIPGSALKGLASHYCHDVWGQRHDAGAAQENTLFQHGARYHSLLFGTTEDGGVVTFHDAWILPQSLSGALRLDVMTPHHPKWQTNEAPPTDFDSPVPVSFLSVAGVFDVSLSWSGPAGASPVQAGAWTELAMQILLEALDDWGVGGKTSSGYGRLVPFESLIATQQPSPSARLTPVALPRPGDKVEARLLEERTKKGGWKALHEASGLSGYIENTADVPAGANADDVLQLIVKFAKRQGLGFFYPTPVVEARFQKSQSKSKNNRPRKGDGKRR